jgi:tRNA(adenine34) deaminase
MDTDHDRFMAIAIEEANIGAAEGEQPFGAVIACNGEVVIRCHSIKVQTCDCTAHSETRAVGLATRKLGRRDLADCTFYATCEPCPMCLGAILNGGIKTLVLGARNRDILGTAKLAFNFKDYTVERFAMMTGWDLTVVEGVKHQECIALYTNSQVELTR